MKMFCNSYIVAGCMALAPVFAAAQAWAPSTPITLTVAMAPGSSNDIIARALSEKLPPKLGQSVVVVNRPGASGVIGVANVARSPADGSYIGIAPSNIYMTPILTPGAGGNFDVIKDLTPVLTAGAAPVILVANPATKIKTPADLVAFLKKNDATSYASPGIGSPMHIAGEMLARATGAQLVHVPYAGVIPATNAVIAGEVPIAIVTLGGIGQFIDAGKLTPVAVLEKQRSELLPTLPTLTESGVPGVETSVFYQIVAPAKTPAAVVARLNAEIKEVLTSADLKERLRTMGLQLTPDTPAEAARLARDTYAKNLQLVKTYNIKAE